MNPLLFFMSYDDPNRRLAISMACSSAGEHWVRYSSMVGFIFKAMCIATKRIQFCLQYKIEIYFKNKNMYIKE